MVIKPKQRRHPHVELRINTTDNRATPASDDSSARNGSFENSVTSVPASPLDQQHSLSSATRDHSNIVGVPATRGTPITRHALAVGALVIFVLSAIVLSSRQIVGVGTAAARTAPDDAAPAGEGLDAPPPPTAASRAIGRSAFHTPEPTQARMMTGEDVTSYLQSRCAPGLIDELEAVTQCADPYALTSAWAAKLSPTALASRMWTIVSVGTNKGYAVASALDGLGVPGFSAAGLAKEIHRYAFEDLKIPGCADEFCGECCQCLGDGAEAGKRQSMLPRARRPSSWLAYLYEASATTHGFLNHYFTNGGDGSPLRAVAGGQAEFLGAGDTADADPHQQASAVTPAPPLSMGTATAFHAYIANENADIEFPDCGLGVEDCHLYSHPRPDHGSPILHPGEYVPASKRRHKIRKSKLDSVLPGDVRYIDVLMTSTGAHDFEVADGMAERFMNSAKVGLYVFRVPKKPALRSFGKQLRRLERAKFVCYVPVMPAGKSMAQGHHGEHARSLLRLTGCDRPEFRNATTFTKPFTVVCVSRQERYLLAALRDLEHESPSRRIATCNVTNAEATVYRAVRGELRMPEYGYCVETGRYTAPPD
jgi:hypothetical protein